MKDLIDYQRFRLEALQKHICELEKQLSEVKTYVFELCENDCPEEYRTIIKQQIYNLEK